MFTLRHRIFALQGVRMENEHHPEVDQFVHTVQVTLAAARETDNERLLAAAATHDIGKALIFHGHEQVGARMILTDHPTGQPAGSDFFWLDVAWLVENHLRVRYFMNGEMRTGKAKELAQHRLFPKLVWLRRFDVSGRKASFKLTETRLKEFNRVLERVGI